MRRLEGEKMSLMWAFGQVGVGVPLRVRGAAWLDRCAGHPKHPRTVPKSAAAILLPFSADRHVSPQVQNPPPTLPTQDPLLVPGYTV